MKKLPKEKRDKIIAICMGAVMATVLMYFGWISMVKDGIRIAKSQLEEAKKKVEEAERFIKKTDLYNQELVTLNENLEQIETNLSTGEMPWVYKIIPEFLSNHKRVELRNVSEKRVGKVDPVPLFPYKCVAYTVNFQAYYHDFGKFLADFENTFPYCWVQNLEIRRLQKSTSLDEEQISCKIDLIALIKPGGTQ